MSVMCNMPSTPPRSMKAPKSVMFFTMPLRTWPTWSSFISTSRFVLRSASSSTRRETTMLRRRLLSLMILNSKLCPSSSSIFGTRRSAIWLPGRNASTPIRSTTTPPLIFFTSVPVTPSSFSCASRIRSQTRMKSAFFFDRTTAPSWSSRCSRKTSISSPSLRLLGSLNSSIATAPSDLNPTSRMTAVSVTRSTFDLTISPSSIFESVPSYSRVIFAISSEEYSSSRPERTRSCDLGALRTGRSSSNSSTSRASTSIQCTGSVVGLRFIFTPPEPRLQPGTGGNLPREQAPRQFNHPRHLLRQREGGPVESHSVRGGFEGGDPPVGIGRIPGRQRLALAPHELHIHHLAPLRQPPPRPFVRCRRQKDLQRGLGKDDSADVPAIDDDSTLTGLHRPSLLGVYPGPHFGDGGQHGDGASHAFAADRLFHVHTRHFGPVHVADEDQPYGQRLGQRDDAPRGPRLAAPRSPLPEIIQRGKRQRPIERARVEMRPAQLLRDQAGGRALAGCRGSVDGDDSWHQRPPVFRRSSKNPGYEIATDFRSDSFTSAPSTVPSTANAIARR